MAAVPRVWRRAAERWGYLAEGQAHKYGVKNGATLLLKIASGESGFNMGRVSSAGARGGTGFMPSTRASYVQKYGVDPWKNPDEAMHATALFMKTAGLGAYNSGGGQTYIHYILTQPVAVGKQRHARDPGFTHPEPSHGPSAASTASSGEAGSSLMHIGLVGALVIGGVGLVGLGATRMLGTAKKGQRTA